ncbi:MAG: hypothetical protein ILP16_02200 [Spirochaetales bacterium]|nr:hypothetical protein [Spirochaetales bacterium]
MKKLIIVLLVVVLGCSAVFAGKLQLGAGLNFLDTYFIADYQGDHFGVEGGIGIPLVYGTAGLIGAISEGKEIDFSEGAEMVLLPAAMVNGYWKAFDGKVFDFRLGLQGDVFSIFTPDFQSVFGLWGASFGFDFSFSERFSLNLTATLPAALPLSIAGDEASKFGAILFYNSENPDIGDFFAIFFGQMLPGMLSEFARISLKWTV